MNSARFISYQTAARRTVTLLVSLCLFGCTSGDREEVDSATARDGGRGSDSGSSQPGNLTDAEAALRAGELRRARDLYQAAPESPQAQFGFALARILLLMEHPTVTAVLARFDLPPMSAAEVWGPNALFAQYRALFRASGTIEVTGLVDLRTELDVGGSGLFTSYDLNRECVELGGAWGENLDRGVSLSISHQLPVSPGETTTLTVPDCTSSQQLEFPVRANFHFEGVEARCSSHFYVPSSDPDCSTTMGEVTTVRLDDGRTSDEPIEFSLNDLRLPCTRYDESSGRDVFLGSVRISGTVTGVRDPGPVDRTSLHPALRRSFYIDDVLASPVDTLTFGDLVDDLMPIVPELDGIADDLDAVVQGDADALVFPGELFGGRDVPVSVGDIAIVAGLLRGISASLVIADAYVLPVSVANLFCGRDGCPDAENPARTDRFNRELAGARPDSTLTPARPRLERALDDLLAGVERLDEQSLLTRDELTSAAFERLEATLRAARRSLQGMHPVPETTPQAQADLQRLLATPPDPSMVMLDPLVYEAFPDGGGRTEYVESYLPTLLEDTVSTGFFDADYRTLDGFGFITMAFARSWERKNFFWPRSNYDNPPDPSRCP